MVSMSRAYRVSGWGVALITFLGLGLLLTRYGGGLVFRSDLVAEARRAYDRGDWDKAAALSRLRLKSVADDTAALRILARSLVRLGRDGAGAAIYNDRLGAARMGAEDLFLLGQTINRQGNTNLALQVWSKAANEHPDDAELLQAVAVHAGRSQRLEDAAAASERLLRLPGREAQGYLLLGAARVALEDPLGAAEAIRRGLELDPEARDAGIPAAEYRKYLARSLLQLGRPAEAHRWLEPLVNGSGADKADLEACWLDGRAALQQGDLKLANARLDQSGGYRTAHPLVPEPSPYVGAARCNSCHPDESGAHQQTRHARTFHHGKDLLDLPRPERPLTDPDDPKVTHTFVADGEQLKVQTKVEDRMFETVVLYAFGTSDRYVTMVGRDNENSYRALRRSFYRKGQESGWERTSGDVGSPDPVENVRGQSVHVRDGIVRCLYCHVTNPRAFREPLKDPQGPESADAGIGCERCHGPGANHIIAIEKDFPDRAIVNVGVSSPAQSSQQCRLCHIVGDASEIKNSREDPIWVRSPGETMTFSRCYTESGGRFGCVTCHDPHRDSERSAVFYEKKCLECHGTAARDPAGSVGTALKEAGDPAAIGSPRPSGSVCKVNPETGCLSCHMPKVPVPILHTSLTDHYIRVRHDGDSTRVNSSKK